MCIYLFFLLYFKKNDALEEVENNIPIENNNEYDPNHTIVATFNSISDVNNFCNTYNHANGYNGLKLGQRIKINNSKYYPYCYSSYVSKYWYIAGFDCECNKQASDGTIYDNGYGICLYPCYPIIENEASSTTAYFQLGNRPYFNSNIHQNILPAMCGYLIDILGDHLINRNVLLANNEDNEGFSKSYMWTTSYSTILSITQLIGKYPNSMCTVYDDGEAIYYLPLFKFISCFDIPDPEYNNNTNRMSRGIWNNRYICYFNATYGIDRDPQFNLFNREVSNTATIFPMIYIR